MVADIDLQKEIDILSKLIKSIPRDWTRAVDFALRSVFDHDRITKQTQKYLVNLAIKSGIIIKSGEKPGLNIVDQSLMI